MVTLLLLNALMLHVGMPDKPKNAADRRAASATKVVTLLLLNALMLHVGIPVKWNSVSGDLEHGFRRSGTLVGA